MATWMWAVIAVVVVLIVALVVIGAARARRRAELKRRFGPEYDRTVEEAGRGKGERRLTERAERRDQFETKELSPEVRERYSAAWRDTQARFVDAPADAVQEADVLVSRVMRDCGYPVEGFDDRSDFVSVDHPHLAEDYRAAHRVAVAETKGKVTTEDRRQAMVHFRSLFSALLGEDEVDSARQRRAG